MTDHQKLTERLTALKFALGLKQVHGGGAWVRIEDEIQRIQFSLKTIERRQDRPQLSDAAYGDGRL